MWQLGQLLLDMAFRMNASNFMLEIWCLRNGCSFYLQLAKALIWFFSDQPNQVFQLRVFLWKALCIFFLPSNNINASTSTKKSGPLKGFSSLLKAEIPTSLHRRNIWMNKFILKVNHIVLHMFNSVCFPFLTFLELPDGIYHVHHANIIWDDSSLLVGLTTRVLESFLSFCVAEASCLCA